MDTKERYTEDKVMERLQKACHEAGSTKAFAKSHDFSYMFIYDVLRKRRPISERLLNTLGFKKVVEFEPLGGNTDEISHKHI